MSAIDALNEERTRVANELHRFGLNLDGDTICQDVICTDCQGFGYTQGKDPHGLIKQVTCQRCSAIGRLFRPILDVHLALVNAAKPTTPEDPEAHPITDTEPMTMFEMVEALYKIHTEPLEPDIQVSLEPPTEIAKVMADVMADVMVEVEADQFPPPKLADEPRSDNAVKDVLIQPSATAVRVKDLLPGDVSDNGMIEAMVITTNDHPIYPGLMLVVWQIIRDDMPLAFDSPERPEFTFDALSPDQVITGMKQLDNQQRLNRWRSLLKRTST